MLHASEIPDPGKKEGGTENKKETEIMTQKGRDVVGIQTPALTICLGLLRDGFGFCNHNQISFYLMLTLALTQIMQIRTHSNTRTHASHKYTYTEKQLHTYSHRHTLVYACIHMQVRHPLRHVHIQTHTHKQAPTRTLSCVYSDIPPTHSNMQTNTSTHKHILT